MRLVLVTPPENEILTAEEARARLNIGPEVSDDVLDSVVHRCALVNLSYGLSAAGPPFGGRTGHERQGLLRGTKRHRGLDDVVVVVVTE